jgi:hypothetical protein
MASGGDDTEKNLFPSSHERAGVHGEFAGLSGMNAKI